MAGTIRVGIAGWVFEPWRGEFYPAGMPQRLELAYASSVLRAIEINATFYGTQKLSSFEAWAEQTPPGFVFPLKGPKFITQSLKSRDVTIPLANFLASGPLRLGPKLGPIVWQLPGSFAFEAERLEAFLNLLPQTAEAAAELAGRHDDHLKGPAFTSAEGVGPVRHALEATHKSFRDPEAIALLRRHNVALVCADTTDWPYRDVTADFTYCRLRGQRSEGGYQQDDLEGWAAQLRAWADGTPSPQAPLIGEAASNAPRDVFAFFVHDDKLHAPRNAQALLGRLGLPPLRDPATVAA